MLNIIVVVYNTRQISLFKFHTFPVLLQHPPTHLSFTLWQPTGHGRKAQSRNKLGRLLVVVIRIVSEPMETGGALFMKESSLTIFVAVLKNAKTLA